jgi:hypothetical protein
MNNKFYFSYSSLVELLRDPKVFYKKYILKQREEKDEKYMKEGKLFHLFVLEPQLFDEKFVMIPTKLPGGYALEAINKLIAKLTLDSVDENGIQLPDTDWGNLYDHDNIVLDILKENNFYQSLKTDTQRVEKVYTPEGHEYFNALRDSYLLKKTIVDSDMVQKAHEKANLVLIDSECQALLNAANSKEDVRKELELQYDIPNYSFGLKGIIDCVKIDYANETIYITDLKTTSKKLLDWYKDFAESEYMYWLQAIIYKELVLSLVPAGSKTAWKLKVNFIVVDKTNCLYTFPVSSKSLYKWQVKTKEKLDVARWHYDNEKYDLPIELQMGKVEL